MDSSVIGQRKSDVMFPSRRRRVRVCGSGEQDRKVRAQGVEGVTDRREYAGIQSVWIPGWDGASGVPCGYGYFLGVGMGVGRGYDLTPLPVRLCLPADL